MRRMSKGFYQLEQAGVEVKGFFCLQKIGNCTAFNPGPEVPGKRKSKGMADPIDLGKRSYVPFKDRLESCLLTSEVLDKPAGYSL